MLIHYDIGRVYWPKNKNSTALEYFKESKKIIKEILG
jgi:hypothetical protein